MKFVITENETKEIKKLYGLIIEEPFDVLDSDSKIETILISLKNTANEIPNNWNHKEREEFIFNKLIELNFVENGDFISKNRKIIKELKSVYNSTSPVNFTTKKLNDVYGNININNVYVIREPFGSQASPDFLFITSKGVFGVEDKSSKTQKITFNTGTPGGNKFTMYYDRKDKTVYLISGKQWGWTQEIEDEFRQFTKQMRDYASNEFKKKFGDRLKNMEYYARPMLTDKNKVKDIVDKDENDVIEILRMML
jgi:hypothetical protein